MKKQDYLQCKLKKQLSQKRQEGIGFLVWKLNSTQKEYIELLGYRVEQYLYFVQTKTFFNINAIHSSLLKDLHYMSKNGRKYQIRQLKQSERKLLDTYGIMYHPLKYKIFLNE